MIPFFLAHWVAFAIASFITSVLSVISFFGVFGAVSADSPKTFFGSIGGWLFFALVSSLLGLFACVGLFVDVLNFVTRMQ